MSKRGRGRQHRQWCESKAEGAPTPCSLQEASSAQTASRMWECQDLRLVWKVQRGQVFKPRSGGHSLMMERECGKEDEHIHPGHGQEGQTHRNMDIQ